MAVRGRPREFDVDKALERAVDVFWRQGYEGTTLSDLTRAMGISRPSLYAAFGNKEETFRQAIARYARVDMAYVDEALGQPTAYEVAAHYLRSNVEAVTRPERPAGCLSIQGGLAGNPEDQRIIDFLAASRRAGEARFSERFRQAIEDGNLSAAEDPADLARYLAAVAAGIAVQAAGGATRSELQAVAERSLRAFPQTPAA
ncbi:TetR/AcrR family transcriptional regulator [Arthrobacter jinronghuae]|uniref:TetR/AcrR family transcriptional regulator n=1 Tax=Arthrobacter jinronghuae TaxID=2964609 RepID=UPI0021050B42|nr:TetR/AcrR family transcriptional regulator [Arthrobacter jinronghuae]UWX80140.1 TetR/AcrR family transcriptional regulator [Arthrobacter jinronghuae]